MILQNRCEVCGCWTGGNVKCMTCELESEPETTPDPIAWDFVVALGDDRIAGLPKMFRPVCVVDRIRAIAVDEYRKKFENI